MVQTQWEKQTGLCLRKQMQQASAKSYTACFIDKKQKTSFLTERERQITPKIPCKLFFFRDSFCTSPFLLPHTLIQQTQMSTRIYPSVSPTSYAMHVQGEMHRNSTGPIVVPQSDVQTVCFLFLHGKIFLDWTHFRGPKDLEIQCLQKTVTSDCQLQLCMSWVLDFLAKQCSFLFWRSTELKNGIWKTEMNLILIKTAIHKKYLTFLCMKFIGRLYPPEHSFSHLLARICQIFSLTGTCFIFSQSGI